MKKRIRLSLLALLLGSAWLQLGAQASNWHFCTGNGDQGLGGSTGDFTFAYGIVANGHTRIATPSPTSVAGNASASFYFTPCISAIASTGTFKTVKSPDSPRTTGYGLTKLEFNDNLLHKEFPSGVKDNPYTRDFSLDYTIVLPTNGPGQAGVATHAHQFLAQYAFNYFNVGTSFEVDAGDYMGGRNAKPGYKHSALLTLIANRNMKPKDSSSPTTLVFELDASSRSETDPASIVTSEGFAYKFKSGFKLQVLALTGLTTADPEIGVSVSLKFKRNILGK